jgi:hypothetical protein
MSAERFLPEVEEDMDPAEVGRCGCLEPTGDAVPEGGDDESED